MHRTVWRQLKKKLNPRTAAARDMESAAKAVRAALQKKLRSEGVAAAKVAVLAGPPGKPARAIRTVHLRR